MFQGRHKTYAVQSMISRDSYYSRYLTGIKPISTFLGVMGNSQKKKTDFTPKVLAIKIVLFGVSIKVGSELRQKERIFSFESQIQSVFGLCDTFSPLK